MRVIYDGCVCSQTSIIHSFIHSFNYVINQSLSYAEGFCCSASIIGVSSSFFSSLKSLIVPLNISIPTDSTTKPASCSHDHFVRPSPNLRLSARRLSYSGQK